jgi:hypothetical protein
MRKILITLAILITCIAAILATWIFGGRQLSLFIDRFGTVEISSAPIHSIAYEGGGTGGILIVNDLQLSLNDTNPQITTSIGSTKDSQFALANGGKIFAFGPLTASGENASDRLATVPQAGDDTSVQIRRSALSWPTPLEFNFMTGQSPSWKRHLYYRVHWKRPKGSTLEMLWRYEQYFYPSNGWANGFMTREGSTGLIELRIRP